MPTEQSSTTQQICSVYSSRHHTHTHLSAAEFSSQQEGAQQHAQSYYGDQSEVNGLQIVLRLVRGCTQLENRER